MSTLCKNEDNFLQMVEKYMSKAFKLCEGPFSKNRYLGKESNSDNANHQLIKG